MSFHILPFTTRHFITDIKNARKWDPFQYAYCDACQCLDPKFSTTSTTITTTTTSTITTTTELSCENDFYKGDGHCDDGNNHEGCEWDGGDCCGENVDKRNYQDCKCLDLPNPKNPCEDDNWKGDGYCDDGNNHQGCEWDGGDCCGKEVAKDYCTACECLDPSA